MRIIMMIAKKVTKINGVEVWQVYKQTIIQQQLVEI